MKECIEHMRALEAEERYQALGEAWNMLLTNERYDILVSLAEIENVEPTPEELRFLSRIDDEVQKTGRHSCISSALKTSTKAVWEVLTPSERELVFHEIHNAL